MTASIFHFPTCMWAVGSIGYMDVVNRLAGGGNLYLSDAVMTLYYFRVFNLTIVVFFYRHVGLKNKDKQHVESKSCVLFVK